MIRPMTHYVLFKDEDFDSTKGEMVGKAWVVHSEENDDEEEAKWMTRTEAKQLAESLGYPFELEGSSMTDEELDAFRRSQD
jgi:hypothetical protein